ncbi:MAG: SRPBCC family protein [Betaproteobacteria bacterium]
MTLSTDRIEKEILLRAPRDRVWRALSNAEEFGNWFGVDLKGQSFRAGEQVRGRFTGSCGHLRVMFAAIIVEITPQRLFSYLWHPYAVDSTIDYSGEEMTLVVMKLAAVDEGTRLTVVESGFDKVPAARRAEALRMNTGGWEAQLQNITDYVSAH